VPNTQKTPINDVSEDGFVSVSVSARSKQVMEVPVTKGCTVTYTIRPESGQRIEASVEFRTVVMGSNDMKVEQIKGKTQLDNNVLSGTFQAPEDGFFSQVFDNTGSWLKSKIVWFKTDIQN
jgi:endoglucanase Acf2